MKGFENMLFNFLNKKKQEDPDAIIQVAAAEIYPVFKKMSSNAQGQVGGDRLLYFISQFAGISCLKAALSYGGMESFIQSIITKDGNAQMTSLMQINTEMGVFYAGEQINRIVFEGDRSPYGSVLRGAGKKESEYWDKMEEIIGKCTKNYGNKDFRIWNGQVDPYAQKDEAIKAYNQLLFVLRKYNLTPDKVVQVYGSLLENAMSAVKNVFPKNCDPVPLSMETIIFNSHMYYEERTGE